MSITAVEVGIMKVAQIAAPGAAFQIVERQIPEPERDKCASRCRLAEFATAMC